MPGNPKSLGLMNTAAIGDTILMSGPVADLRYAYPDATITAFTGPSNYEAAQLIPEIDSVILLPVPRIRPTLDIIRQYQFDILMDFGPWPRLNALLTLLARAEFTIGFKTEREYRHYGYDLAVEHSQHVHELENHRRIVRTLGATSRSGPHLERPKFRDLALASSDYVILHLWGGGTCAPLKQWPLDRWIALAEMFAEANYDVIFTGARGQREANRVAISKVTTSYRQKMRNAAGLSLAETAALLASAKLVVSVDTGIMHMAAALDVPLVALHGPTSSRRWGPINPNSAIVESPLQESGYLNLGFEFPRDPPKCMEAISCDSVRDACLRQLTNQEGSVLRAVTGSVGDNSAIQFADKYY